MTQRNDSAAFFTFWDKAGTFVLSNMLWLLFSLPVVTLPAATAALFATLAPLSRGQQVEPLAAFWRAFREHWRKSSIIGGIDLLVFGIIILNLSIFGRMDGNQPMMRASQILTVFVGVAALMVNLYLWPLLISFRLTIRQLFDTAVRMAFGHALWSLLVLCIVGAMLWVSIQLPAMFLILATGSACAMVIMWGTWRVIRRYVAPEELIRFEG